MSAVEPFRIAIPDEDLTDLRDRLHRTRWPERECVADWSQGIPLDYTRELAAYWADGYDWRARERHSTVRPLHHRHRRPGHPFHPPALAPRGRLSPRRHARLARLNRGVPQGDRAADRPNRARRPAEDAFHVVCPSLPGYGFSDKPAARAGVSRRWRGVGDADDPPRLRPVRRAGRRLGRMVTTAIGVDGGRCAAIHLNMPSGPPTSTDSPTAEEQAALAASAHYEKWDSGYMKQQSTRPQTLGYGLTDSPAGQLAWIVEKFRAWTDCDGHPENALSRDEMLDNVMLYWLTASAASSARLYWQGFRGSRVLRDGRVELPTGVASFPKEILRAPRPWCESRYNITHWTDMPRGGHFAAFEQPELFVDDIRTFFAGIR